MTAFCSYTGGESCTPLIYCFVYDVLSNAVPHTQQALTQLVDVIYAFLADLLLHYSPDLIIKGVHIWAVWGCWSGEMKSGVSRHKSAIVSRALCAGVMSCWNMKLCNLEWKWTATIIVKYCWKRSCCHALRNIGWQFHIPTGQCTCSRGAIDQWHARLTTDISSFTR